MGSGAFVWMAFDLTNATREVLGHHFEACLDARPHKQAARCKAPRK